jgi:hypothetical protein
VARAVEWRRNIGEYTEGVLKSNQHLYQLGSMDEGETLTRIRFTWQATHSTTTAADGLGFVIAQGILVVPSGTLEAALPDVYDEPNEPYVWWEAGMFQPMLVGNGSSGPYEVDVYPFGDLQRDTRAQRVADVGGSDIWFLTSTSPLSPGQCDHYLSVSASMLIILPA